MIDPRWFVVAGILLAVALCGFWRRERNFYLHRRAQMNDSLTLAAQARKPQAAQTFPLRTPRAAGLTSDRIYADRRVLPMRRRTK